MPGAMYSSVVISRYHSIFLPLLGIGLGPPEESPPVRALLAS
jgi:hypothetical protein